MKYFLKKNIKLFFASVIIVFSFLSSNSQALLLDSRLRAENITSEGFTLNIITNVHSGYELYLYPLNHEDTIHHLVETTSLLNHEYILTGAPPSTIYEADLRIFDSSYDTTYYTFHYATGSLSQGNILAYFNHEVDHSYSLGTNAVSLISSMVDTLVAYIDRVDETLDIAIYNSFGDSSTEGIAGAINDAYDRGVDIRIVYHGSTANTMLNYINPGIPTNPHPAGAWQGLMHHKFVVADANHEDPDKSWVWTGSTNWTQHQISGPDKNNVIILYDQTLALAYTMEFEKMWGSNTNIPNPENAQFGSSKPDNTPKEFVIGGIKVECYFSPSDGTEMQIYDFILTANHNLTIATMLITRDVLADAILATYYQGVQNNIAVLLDTQNPLGSQKPYLMESLPMELIKEYTATGQMHHKLAIADNGTDDAKVLTGSHNWSNSAEVRNDENTLIIHDKDIANQYYQAVAYLFSEVGGSLINTNVDKRLNDINLSIYPNPASSYIKISIDNIENYNIIITDVKGRTITRKSVKNKNYRSVSEICIRNLDKGFYFVNIQNNNGIVVANKKLIVN